MRGAALSALAVAFLFAGAAHAATHRMAEPPLALAKEGFFYVGGHKVDKPSGPVLVDDMFVEYQIPAKRTHRWPIVMIHGGSTTGATFLGTPDGREGWAEYFLRRGWAVYIVDQPTRGRSSYDAETDGPLERAPAASTAQMFTAPERYKTWPQARLHNQFPGAGLPGDPTYEAMAAMQQASIGGGLRMDTINRDALAALLDRIGPAVLLTHSRSGPFGWLAADARPGKVKGIIAVEPNGPPFKNPATTTGTGPPTQAERGYGITYERLTFDPPLGDPADLKPVEEKPEGPDLIGCWRMGAPRRLPHLEGVPILIVTSEGGYHAQYDQCTSEFLTQAGVANQHLRLETIGIHGNGHLMMLEKNNLQIAGVIDSWLARHVH